MKPKNIGIIGGAGPQAGAYLLERIVSLSTTVYGCYRDADYPNVFLISFPFSEMLSEKRNSSQLRQELSDCLKQLRDNGASVLAIACNTLHAFLDEEDELDDLVHLPRTVAEELLPSDTPLVFCTSTSAQLALHRQFFRCVYPDEKTQWEVDRLIDHILKGGDKSVIFAQLEELIQRQTANTIILGCTELSLFSAQLSIPNKLIVDPLEIMANKILKRCFLNDKGKLWQYQQ